MKFLGRDMTILVVIKIVESFFISFYIFCRKRDLWCFLFLLNKSTKNSGSLTKQSCNTTNFRAFIFYNLFTFLHIFLFFFVCLFTFIFTAYLVLTILHAITSVFLH